MSDATNSADYARGVAAGRSAWRPFARGGSIYDQPLADLFAIAFAMGVAIGRDGPPVEEPQTFLEGVFDGFDVAEQDHDARAATHRTHPGCDPHRPTQMCQYCSAYTQAMARSRADHIRWQEETTDPERVFVITSGAEAMIHTRECSVVARTLAYTQERMQTLTPDAARHGGEWVEWPRTLSRREAEELRRRRCSRCSPDLPERRPRAGRAASGRSAPAPPPE